nr:hypothetical protein [Tanacetum cinerariifolium]
KLLSGIEDSHHVPSDAMHNPPQPLKVRKTLFQNSQRYTHFHRLSHSELVVSGEVLSMFMDVSYPLSFELMKKMLIHKLEIDSDFVENDLTTAEQLIQFIKNQIVAAQASPV